MMPAAGQPPALAPQIVRVERLVAALDLEVAQVAAAYLDTSLSMEAATVRLRDEALVLDRPGMLAFIEKQRSRVLAYPLGRRLVLDAVTRASEADRWPTLCGDQHPARPRSRRPALTRHESRIMPSR